LSCILAQIRKRNTMQLISTLTLALCLIGCVDIVYSVRCYDCNSFNETCNDPYSPGSSARTCIGPQCFKSVVSTGSTTTVIRTCATEGGLDVPNRCESRNDGSTSNTLCACTTDLCNSAYASFGMSPVLLFVVCWFTVKLVTFARHP